MVGREGELGVLEAFLERPADAPAAFVLEGEAGIGKTTLWLAGVEAAREQGFRVLRSRPAEAERGLAFAALGDLLEPVLDDVLPSLPPPRRRALEIALLLDGSSESADPRALGVALRNGLEILAANRPLVVAIDDVQWLDPASERTIAFALRRLGRGILFLLARRIEAGAEPPGLETALAPGSVERVAVGPLSVGATQALLRERLDRAFARPTLLRIHDTARGNPFYALELARALGSDVDPMLPLPVPETLDALVRGRLDALPARTRRVLVVVSALGDTTRAVLRRAGVDDDDLEPARWAQVVEPGDRGEIRFTHPLFASALYRAASPHERRTIHRSLSRVVDDPLERARHVALATGAPDADVAATLEEATALAFSRGAPIVAAELGEHALRLTPPESDEDFHRRTIALARVHLANANRDRARALADELLEGVPPGTRRAEALVLVSDTAFDGVTSLAHLREALEEPGVDPALQARIHQTLGWSLRFTEGLRVAERHARAALVIADRLGDDALRAGALATVSATRLHLGEPDALWLGEEAYELVSRTGDRRLHLEVALVFSSTLIWTARLDRARVILDELLAEWRDLDEEMVGQIVWRLVFVELAVGNLAAAARCAQRAREVSDVYEVEGPSSLWADAQVRAWRGDLDGARRLAEEGLALALRDNPWFAAYLVGLLGVVGFWSGDPRAALEHFAKAEALRAAVGSEEPILARWRADYIEALLELGHVGDALALLEPWEADAVRLEREPVLALAVRSHGLVAAARGEIGEAQAAPRGGCLAPRGDRRSARAGPGAARAGRRQAPRAAEACGAGRDPGGAPGLRGVRGRGLGRQGALGARVDRRTEARGRADRCRAPRRSARRPGPDEPRGRRRALPRGADRPGAPHAHLREARRALADRARARARARALSGAKFRGSRDFNAACGS